MALAFSTSQKGHSTVYKGIICSHLYSLDVDVGHLNTLRETLISYGAHFTIYESRTPFTLLYI